METKIEIQKSNVMAAYRAGNEDVKNMLANLFPDLNFKENVMDRIKTWEDVCDELDISTGWEDNLKQYIQDVFHFNEGEMKCAIAHMKIFAIAKALNEGWELTKDAEEREEGYGIYWIKRDGVRGDVDFQAGSFCAPGYVRARELRVRRLELVLRASALLQNTGISRICGTSVSGYLERILQ